MGLALSINSEPGVVSDLVDTTTARQRRILRTGPSLYMTPDARYFETDGAGKLSRWHDAIGQGHYAPKSAPLSVIDEGDGLRSLNFTATAGQVLRDSLNLDRLPAFASPFTIVSLVRVEAATANFGGIMGNLAPYDLTATGRMVAYYIDAGTDAHNLQMRFGDTDTGLFSTAPVADGTYHLAILTAKGSGPGAQVIQDGAAQPVVSNTLTGSGEHPNARKVIIGAYGENEADPFMGRIAALALLPAYVGDGENAALLSDLIAEFGAYRASLNS